MTRTLVAAMMLALTITGVGVSSATADDAATGTTPRYSFADAIREHIMVPSSRDDDRDGKPDRISVDIIRPRNAGKVPVILNQTPYDDDVARGLSKERRLRGGDGVVTSMNGYVDNWFVSRGYAVAITEMPGVGQSEGCFDLYGPAYLAGTKAVLDHLQKADWSNGRIGMIGKSADGMAALMAGTLGHPGLATVVPIAAPSDWYLRFHPGGASGQEFNLDNPLSVNGQRSGCRAFDRTWASNGSGKEYDAFYKARNVLERLDNYSVPTLLAHGLRDFNVNASEGINVWNELQRRNIPSHLWLNQFGHIDPFDLSRDRWITKLHAWFDHYLYGMDNGAENQDRVTVQRRDGSWETGTRWPLGRASIPFTWGGKELRRGFPSPEPSEVGTVRPVSRSPYSPNIGSMIDSTQSSSSRVVVVSEPLASELDITGSPLLRVPLRTTTGGRISVALVDYGRGNHIDTSSVFSEHVGAGKATRFGDAGGSDRGMFVTPRPRRITSDADALAFGWATAGKKNPHDEAPRLSGSEWTWQTFRMEPAHAVIPRGHRIGLVFTTNGMGMLSNNDIPVTIGTGGMLLLDTRNI